MADLSTKISASVLLSNFNQDDNLRRFHPANIAKLVTVCSGPKFYYNSDREKFSNGSYLCYNPSESGPIAHSGSTLQLKPTVQPVYLSLGGFIISLSVTDSEPITEPSISKPVVWISMKLNSYRTDIVELNITSIDATSDLDHGEYDYSLLLYSSDSSNNIYTPVTDFDSLDGGPCDV